MARRQTPWNENLPPRAGADVNAKDKSGRTALSIARAAHDDETVAILLAAGAKD
jgi:ankyrin repeat protein